MQWYNSGMTPKLTNIDDVRKALVESHGQPVEVEDDQTHTVYVMVTREEFQKKYQPLYDDSEPNPRDFYSSFAETVKDDLESSDADIYDDSPTDA